MTIGFLAALRNNMLDEITALMDAGAGAALLRIYNGTRPATGGSATTLLAELTFSDPVAAGAAAGVLTFSAITQDSSANATGTATWARVVDSDATFVMDLSVGTSGEDINLNSVSITITQAVSVTSATITAPNA
jgi:hypothetical protein